MPEGKSPKRQEASNTSFTVVIKDAKIPIGKSAGWRVVK